MHKPFLRGACFAAGLATLSVHATIAQRPIYVAPNASRDQPASLIEQCQWNALVKVLEPYVAQARATYPRAKQQFLAGLRAGQTFFVTVRLADSLAHHEQVFVAVDSVIGDRVVGRLASDIGAVRGYRAGQRYEARETEVVDWLMSQPDGSEVGNVVGKFLDAYRPPRDCRDRDRTG
jgi:hypothetical protein